MKKGQTAEGRVLRAEFPNKGIVETEDGLHAVVKNSIPGQKVSFFINKLRRGKCEGRLLEVLEKSPMEMEEAACPHFGTCGGCTYQSLSYEKQLEVLAQMRGKVGKRELDSICLVLGIPASSGDEDSQIFNIKKHLETRMRYDNRRLR